MIELLAGERQESETDKAAIACNDYLRMGPGRSLEKLQEVYSKVTGIKPPTQNLRVMYGWSSRNGWVERARAYDAAQDAAKTAEIERLRTEGLAADYERIRQLGRMWAALDKEFNDGVGIWYMDIKMSAKGDTVDVPAFNAALLTQMRGVLDDLAKEVGGRKQSVEHSTSKADPFTIEVRHVNYRDGLADGIADPAA